MPQPQRHRNPKADGFGFSTQNRIALAALGVGQNAEGSNDSGTKEHSQVSQESSGTAERNLSNQINEEQQKNKC